MRPYSTSTRTRCLPASLKPEDVRRLHALSRQTGRSLRRLVTDAVVAALDEADEATSKAA